MIYRLHVVDDEHESQGYDFFSSYSKAHAHRLWLNSEDGGEHDLALLEIDSEPTPKTKAEVIALLRKWADHPDNG